MAHMRPATLHLVGIAERDVLPDRFVAALTLRSRLFASPQEAITATADARARVLRDLGCRTIRPSPRRHLLARAVGHRLGRS